MIPSQLVIWLQEAALGICQLKKPAVQLDVPFSSQFRAIQVKIAQHSLSETLDYIFFYTSGCGNNTIDELILCEKPDDLS